MRASEAPADARRGKDPQAALRACAAGALALVFAAGVWAQGQPTLTGTWAWTRKSNGCAESYDFRPDGTLIATSGEARGEQQYTMAWAPEANGRYKLTLHTIKDNGARDCSGITGDRTGQQRVVYLLFGGSRQTMILCNSLDGADCIGPLQRRAP